VDLPLWPLYLCGSKLRPPEELPIIEATSPAPAFTRDPALGINTGRESFARPTGDGALLLMGDGSVRFLANKVDPNLLRALSTPAGLEDAGDLS